MKYIFLILLALLPQAYAGDYSNPTSKVFGSGKKHITIVGEIGNPRPPKPGYTATVKYEGKIDLKTAIKLAGGLNVYSQNKYIHILRKDSITGDEKRIKLKPKEDPKQFGFPLVDGDKIIIDRKSIPI